MASPRLLAALHSGNFHNSLISNRTSLQSQTPLSSASSFLLREEADLDATLTGSSRTSLKLLAPSQTRTKRRREERRAVTVGVCTSLVQTDERSLSCQNTGEVPSPGFCLSVALARVNEREIQKRLGANCTRLLKRTHPLYLLTVL